MHTCLQDSTSRVFLYWLRRQTAVSPAEVPVGPPKRRQRRFSHKLLLPCRSRMFAAPQQLELLLRLADKVDFSLLRSLWLMVAEIAFGLNSLSLAHRIFQVVSWCQRIQIHYRTSCGLACVTLLVTLHGKGRCISCSCEFFQSQHQ